MKDTSVFCLSSGALEAKNHGAAGLLIGGGVYQLLLALGSILLGCTLSGAAFFSGQTGHPL